MRRIIIFLLLATLTAACQNIAGYSLNKNTGINGRVYRIDAPAIPAGWTPPPLKQVSTIIIENSSGDTIKTASTDSLGKYQIHLLSGEYYLLVKESLIPQKTGPFTVNTGSITNTKAYYDGGIR